MYQWLCQSTGKPKLFLLLEPSSGQIEEENSNVVIIILSIDLPCIDVFRYGAVSFCQSPSYGGGCGSRPFICLNNGYYEIPGTSCTASYYYCTNDIAYELVIIIFP